MHSSALSGSSRSSGAASERKAKEEARRAALSFEERAKEDKRNTIIAGVVVIAVILVVIVVSCVNRKETPGAASSSAGRASATTAAQAVGQSDDEQRILKRDSFEAIVGDWPLTSDTAQVVCGIRRSTSLGVKVDGRTYALNGTAKTWEDWADITPIWADETDGLRKVNIGDLLDYAQRQCA